MQVLPEVVYNANGVLTMDYGNAGFAIASSLIKPVVDHEQRIKALEKENEELKQEIKRLTNLMKKEVDPIEQAKIVEKIRKLRLGDS